jgi:peptidoglycan/xylan/chitin deacetylase (PgdA/CDA1 family)
MLPSLALLALPLVAAAPASWYQPRDSDVHNLFKRQGPAPDPSKPDFASHYPASGRVANGTLPQAWVDKYNQVKAEGKIPSHEVNPVAVRRNGNPVYEGRDGADKEICSFNTGCHTDDDYFLAPDGTFVLTFDDGPTPASPALYDFMQEHNITRQATHFMIGGNIAADPITMQRAFKQGGHIAVHTWSHPQMTTLSDEAVMGELGWTMQVIADLTGGRVPAYWRPSYGDTDNRVRAIAKHVFGMDCVLWNRDTNDWKIGQDQTLEGTRKIMQEWWVGPKTPGILALEHELNKDCVDVFIAEYPAAIENGWQIKSVADAYGLKWYQNADSNEGPVTNFTIAVDTQANLNITAPILGASSSVAPEPSANASVTGNASTSGNASAPAATTTPNSGASALVFPGLASLLLGALAVLAL